MVSVKISELRKVYEQRFGPDIEAVKGVSFELEGDDILSLVGPSGCGKTTVLRTIAGLEEPTSGDIEFDGESILDKPPQDRNIAMLFQDPALWENMTAREHMAYGLKIKRVDKATIDERVTDTAEMLGISNQLDKQPSELSGGQQQRVAMGRALVQEPDLFLLDEPMSDLDAALKEELRPLIQQVIKDAGVPGIYVTHDQEEAMTLSDKLVVMNEGEIEQEGVPIEVYNDPQSKFVAEFIGKPTMNFFTPTVRHDDGQRIAEIEGLRFSIDGYTENVEIGVRPADVRVLDDGEGIAATHELDETVGERKYSYFSSDHGDVTVITPQTFSGDGDQYVLQFEQEHVHTFDTEDSGSRGE